MFGQVIELINLYKINKLNYFLVSKFFYTSKKKQRRNETHSCLFFNSVTFIEYENYASIGSALILKIES